ncbi:glycine--tRNA ligase [Candidatus Woesearchaeota archaeon]|nr:glycine--tRNA ligase [Candidatus Woesearchaeota archaeon]
MISIDELAVFCKKKGFVYPSSDIYGGIAGFWDFGPLGVELLNNIRAGWWKYFVQSREDIVGMDGSIISNPKIWKASGHLESFQDIVLTCSKCKTKLRADHFIDEKLDINVEGMSILDLNKIIKKNNLKCPKCSSNLKELKGFNLLFKTHVGAEEDSASAAYLRGETAQGMFTDFRLIAETSRQKLPFGIAQIGKCFRNEISPRDFLFRSREFTIAELEFFVHPKQKKCPYLIKKCRDIKLFFLDAEAQENGKKAYKEKTIGGLLKEKRLDEWHAYWLAEQILWFRTLGLDMKKLKIREHTKNELSHYSSATFDIDFEYPFGSKEVAGIANRGIYDLTQHMKESGKSMELYDEETKSKIIPRAIEPTFGMERVFLAVLVDAYNDDKKRGNIVLKLNPKLAPIAVGVFPLVNKLDGKSREIFDILKTDFSCTFDRGGSIGRRYARADEQGIPFCVTIDFDTLEDNAVTIRDRDTTKQIRVKIDELEKTITKLIHGIK